MTANYMLTMNNNSNDAQYTASASSCAKNTNMSSLMRTVFAVGIFVAFTVLAIIINVAFVSVVISLALILAVVISLIISLGKLPLKKRTTVS